MMTLTPRPIYDSVHRLTTEPWIDNFVRIKLVDGSMSVDGFFPPDELVVPIETDGTFECELWPNTEGLEGSEYHAIIVGRKKYKFTVPPGERVQLTELILGSEPVTPETEELLSAVVDSAIATHSTSPTAHENLRWKHRGTYGTDTTYNRNDVVELDGSTYVAIATTSSNQPPNDNYWRLVASKGDPGVPGSDGAQGPQGEAGADGAPGEQGPVGAAGVVAATAPLIYDAQTQTLSIATATTGAAGSMSAADKVKLDGIEAGAISTTTGDGRYARTSVGVTQLFGDPGGNVTGIFVRSGSGYGGLFGSTSGVAFSAYTSGTMGAFEVTVLNVSGDSAVVVATDQRYGDATPGIGYGVRRRVQLKSTLVTVRDAAYFDTVWTNPTDAVRSSAHRISLFKEGVQVEVFGLDTNDTTEQTGMLLLHNGTQKRVKVKPDGTLYIDM